MADQDLGVDIVVGENELERSLRASAASMREMLAVAKEVQTQVQRTADRAGEFSRHIAELKLQRDRLPTDDLLGIKVKNDQIRESTKNAQAFNNEIREEIRLQQSLGLARRAAERSIGGETRLSGGRTVNDAQAAEAALKNAILGINTTADQISGRLALASSRAAERMLGATGDAIEKSFQAAAQRQMARNTQFAVPGFLDAKTNRSGIQAERLVRDYGGVTSLDEKDALDAVERNRAFLQRLRQASFAAQQRSEDKDQREQAAQAERDRKTVLGIKQRSMLAEQRAEEKTSAEQVSEAERRAKFLQGLRTRSMLAEQRSGEASDREAASQAERDRKTVLGIKQRSMLQEQRAEERAQNEQTSEAERQRKFLQGLRTRSMLAEQRAQEKSDRDAGRRTPEARQAAVDRQIENRDALMTSRGGADMFTFQARLASNYAIFGAITAAITGSMTAIIQFDEALKQFQAITNTADSEMGRFRSNLLGVAADSKFSVTELTQVAVALGQTGLAADGVIKALRPVANLAAASGSTLQESVEAITAVLGAYNMEAGRAGDVADVFVAALNRTKLTMGQLQLGIQYAANIARDSGVSFSELTASIGAMSQAGVKSGSTIGTGIRQLITELSSPSEKLRGVLKELGIDIASVDLRTQGFTSVLTTLREKGFGTAEALRSLDLRAANAFSALSGQADKIKILEQEFLLTSAATESAAKANESFTASGQRLTNVLFGIVDKGFSPLVAIMARAAGGTADLLAKLQDTGVALPLIAGGIASIATAVATVKIGSLLAGLTQTTALAGLFSGPVLPVAAGFAALGGIALALSQITSEADRAKKRLDELTGIENGLLGRQSTIQTATADISSRIQTLIDRREVLNRDPILKQNAIIDAQKAFGEFGLAVDVGSTSVDGLIKALQNLRGEMGKEMPVLLAQQLSLVAQKIEELRKLEETRERANQAGRYAGPSFMGAGTSAGDPLVNIRSIGPQGQQVADYLTGKTRLDPTNPRGGDAARLMGELGGERITLSQSRTAAELLEDTPYRRELLTAIDRRIKLVDDAIKLFTDKIAAVTNQQGLRVTQDRLAMELRAKGIAAQPDTVGLPSTFEALRARQDSAVLAAQDGGLKGMERVDAMRAAARTTDPDVRAALDTIRVAKEKAIAGGATQAEADMAFHEVVDQLNGLLKASTKEIRDRFVAAQPEARASLQAQIRNAESQLTLAQRQATTANDPNRVSELAKFAEDQQLIINRAREKLFGLDQGPNSEQVIAASPELTEKAAALKASGEAARQKLIIDYAEIHRRVQQQTLSFEITKQGERKDLIEAQIKGLEKVRDDARSSPEQAAAAVREINRLLGEVATILKGINTLTTQKTDLKVPDNIGPTAAYKGGSAQDYILNTLKSQGASEERIRYALASGQIESGYAPDVLSGARKSSAGATGIFQFMPKTWEKMYGTRNVDVDYDAQIKAFQSFTDRNAGTFQSNMGRQASAEELYLMHQQGAGGALALLRGGSGTSALDALTNVYGSRATASSAITGNRGSLDMSAEEFANFIMRKFRKAENEVGNPFGSTGKDAQKRSDQNLQDESAETIENRKRDNEKKGAEAARASALADLKKQDKALSETYDTQLTLLKRVQDPAAAAGANAEAFKTLGQLYEKARQQDALREDRTGPEGKEEAARATRSRYGELYSQQGLNAADTVGKAYEKQYTDELTRLQNMKKELERPENTAREGNTEMLNSLNEQINALTKRNELQGSYEKAGAQIVALEQTLKEMKAAGLDDDKQTLAIRQRIADLQGQRKLAEPNMNFAATQKKTERSYGEAFTGATDSFLKSRGILDLQGNVVDPVVRAQKTLEESLNAIGSSFDTLFTSLFTGTESAGAALKKFATSTLSGVMSALSKSLTSDIMKMLLGGGSKDSGGGIGGFISGLFGSGGSGGIDVGATSWMPTFALGGPIRMAGGGGVPSRSASTAGRDSVPIEGMPGEFMLRKSAVDAIGVDTLNQVNQLGAGMLQRQPKLDRDRMRSSASAQSNVYIVDRDQVPQPGPNEFVYAIGDNINKGGSIKQLIKRVAAGG